MVVPYALAERYGWHYGTAPCGCERGEEFSRLCEAHRLCFGDGSTVHGWICPAPEWVLPWHAAEAIEQGLRAIAARGARATGCRARRH
jgi:hypothetical protein